MQEANLAGRVCAALQEEDEDVPVGAARKALRSVAQVVECAVNTGAVRDGGCTAWRAFVGSAPASRRATAVSLWPPRAA